MVKCLKEELEVGVQLLIPSEARTSVKCGNGPSLFLLVSIHSASCSYVSICSPEASIVNRRPLPSLDRIAYVEFTRLCSESEPILRAQSLQHLQQRNNNTRLACLLTIHIRFSATTLVSDLPIPVGNLGDKQTLHEFRHGSTISARPNGLELQ